MKRIKECQSKKLRKYRYKLRCILNERTVNVIIVLCIVAIFVLSFIMLSNFAKIHIPDDLCKSNYNIRAYNIANGNDYNYGVSGYITTDLDTDVLDDKSKRKATKSYNALSVDNDKLIQINLSDDQKKLYQSISTPDCPLFIEAKVIDNNRVEITKVHNINDSDNIYSLLNFARNTLFFIIILVIIISIFL